MIDIKRLFDFPYYTLEKYNLDAALVTKYNGKWVATSSQEFVDKGNQLSRGLLRLGVKPNDKIAIISSTNRTEWNIVDMAVLQLGAQDVPIYPTISEEDYEYVLNHSESIYCFVSDKEVLDKVNETCGCKYETNDPRVDVSDCDYSDFEANTLAPAHEAELRPYSPAKSP